MTELRIPFEPWDRDNDVPLHRPGTDYGFGMVNSGVQPGHGLTRREDDRDQKSGDAIDGVIGLLAGCTEWLREYGFTAEEVQSRVRAYIGKNRGSLAQQTEKDAIRIRGVSVPLIGGITVEQVRSLQ